MSTPTIALVDGHYPAFKDITGLAFDISIVMQATDITHEQAMLREEQAERLVRAWNQHDQLIAALRVIRNQSVGPDWTPEQALAFIKQHAAEAIAKATGIAA